MSFIDSAVQNALAELVGGALILPRNIGGFVADVTVEEQGTDEVTITRRAPKRYIFACKLRRPRISAPASSRWRRADVSFTPLKKSARLNRVMT